METMTLQSPDPAAYQALLVCVYACTALFCLAKVAGLYSERTLTGAQTVPVAMGVMAVLAFFALTNVPGLMAVRPDATVVRASAWAALLALLLLPSGARALKDFRSATRSRTRDALAAERALRDLAVNATDPTPHLALADICERQGNIEEAIRQLERALEKAPLPQARAKLRKLRARR